MGWVFEQRHDGLFTMISPVGRPMLDVAFRSDIPQAVRTKMMTQMLSSMNINIEESEINPLHTPV